MIVIIRLLKMKMTVSERFSKFTDAYFRRKQIKNSDKAARIIH